MKLTAKLPDQLRSLSRFPVPIAIAVAAAIFFNLEIAGLVTVRDQLQAEIDFALSAGFFGSLGVSLWSVARKANVVVGTAAAGLVSLALGAMQFSHGHFYSESVATNLGLIAATLVAAHLRAGTSVESFWFFDLELAIAATLGMLAHLVISGGISLILVSAGYLFDLHIRWSIYSHLWTTGGVLIGPVYGLASIPLEIDRPFVAGENPHLLERGVATVLNFALAPLVLIYALMLHMYAIKIAIFASMPKGQIGWLVATFGGVGTIAYMVAYPWRDRGYRPVRWLTRAWFALMVVPTILLTLAVWQRIAQHGVTPERFYLALFETWMWSMVVYFGMKRGRFDLRAIPASVAFGLILFSFGPWGPIESSIRSQLHQFRLVAAEEHLALDDGRLSTDPAQLATFARLVHTNHRLHSTVETLKELDALDRIKPNLSQVTDAKLREKIAELVGNDLLGRTSPEASLSSKASPQVPPSTPKAASTPTVAGTEPYAVPLGITSYHWLVGPLWVDKAGGIRSGSPGSQLSASAGIQGMSISFFNTMLSVGWGNANLSFNLVSVMNPRGPLPNHPIMVPPIEGHGMLVLVRPQDLADPKVENFEVWLLLDKMPGAAG